MRCALITMRLCAAWRKTSVKRAVGITAEFMMSASTWPGPTDGNWSASPTSRSPACGGNALMSDAISGRSTIETSSTTNRSQASGSVSQRLKPPLRGSASSKRWMVLAANPVLSAKRLAARPVGAHSATATAFAHRILRMELTRVVFPTPGPPVTTSSLLASANATAARWLSARPPPHFFFPPPLVPAAPQRPPELLLDPSDGSLRVDRGPWRPLADKRLESVGDEPFGAPEISEKNTAAVVDHG